MKDIIKSKNCLSYSPNKKFPLYIIISIIFALISCEEYNLTEYINKNSDVFLILSNDGYLHALDKGKKEYKWKTFFGNNLLPVNINSHKLLDDIYIYPINDKLFILKDKNMISFETFVKELINCNSMINDDTILEGKIDRWIYKIDLKNGNILDKKNKMKNYTYFRDNLKNETIIVKKVDYYLLKREKNKKENIMNISYSSINIELKKNKNSLFEGNDNNMNEIHKLLNDLNIQIDINKIITIHSYCYHRNELLLIYDKNIIDKNLQNFITNNNKKTIKQLNNYKDSSDEKHNDYKIDKYNDIITKINNNNILSNFIHFFISIIIIIIAVKFLPRIFIINVNNTNIFNENYNYNYSDDSSTNSTITSNSEENSIIPKGNNNDNNNSNNSYKEICYNVNTFSITSKPDIIKKSKEKKKLELIGNNSLLTTGNKNCTDLSLLNVPKYHSASKLYSYEEEERRNELFFPNKNVELEEKEEDDEEEIKNDFNIINHKSESNSDVLKKLLKNKCCCDKIRYLEEYMKLVNNKIINEIKEEDEDFILKVNFINEYKIPKNNITKKLLSNCNYLNIPNNKKNNNLLPDDNYGQINKDITHDSLIKEDIKENNNSSKMSNENVGGIWNIDDEDIDEDNDNKINIFEEKLNDGSINKKINNISHFSINSNNICEEKKSKISDRKEIIRKEVNVKSRLDKDFKNLEKIGEGGFGIVLKGIHRLDKGVCAIKIIKLSNINDRDNIINEATTMTSITSKHIVQYKTCWIDNVLGSASKFFNDDSESSSVNLSNSVIVKKNDKNKIDSNDIIIDDEEDEEEDDGNDNDLSLSNYKSNDILSIKNKNDNSQEIAKKSSKNISTKYCCNYRDDSHIGTKSIISNKYLNENMSEAGTLLDGKYFFILMEYCDGLTLEQYIHQNANKIIDRKKIYSFLSQILKSLVKIHSGGIIHRDIKPSNIFIKNDQLKIGDFGLATRYNNGGKLLKSKKIEGTPLYLSPEQMNYKTYNEKVDIYACGITLYEMCACFSTSMERYENIMNLKNNLIINEKVSKNFPEESILIKKMINDDYNERPSAKEILNSNLFVNLGKDLGF